MILAVILVIGGYYDFDQIAKLIKGGFGSTGPTAALFVFSVLYFGIMTDAGMFDVIIGQLMKLVGDNVIGKMHMRPTTLLRIAVLSMGVLNLMPWAGPTMRAATVLGIEAGELWKTLLPIQAFGIVLSLAHAVLAGMQEKARGAGLNGKLAQIEGEVAEEEKKADASANNELARPNLFIFNIGLTIAVIAIRPVRELRRNCQDA